MPWPGLLAECLEAGINAASPASGEQKRTHLLFGLIGHAVDPGYLDLSDHDDLICDIRQLYRNAGPTAPRAGYESAAGTDR
ncbi:hypothetical protein [Streptomyces lydicus]|uniref:hypothetical protein n=1 Tax=Streptomyces lydicus TaxID=47763 RepID=UPI003789CBFE